MNKKTIASNHQDLFQKANTTKSSFVSRRIAQNLILKAWFILV